MRVAGEISQHGLGSGEGALAIDEPFGVAQRRQDRSECVWLSEMSVIAEELQLPGRMSGGQLLQHQAPEQLREHEHG